MLEKFKQKNQPKSKNFPNRKKWSKYIDESYEENEIIKELEPVIKGIEGREKVICQ